MSLIVKHKPVDMNWNRNNNLSTLTSSVNENGWENNQWLLIMWLIFGLFWLISFTLNLVDDNLPSSRSYPGLNPFPFCSSVLEPDFHLEVNHLFNQSESSGHEGWIMKISIYTNTYIGLPELLTVLGCVLFDFSHSNCNKNIWQYLTNNTSMVFSYLRYFLVWNSFSSSISCSLVKAVLRRRVFPFWEEKD